MKCEDARQRALGVGAQVLVAHDQQVLDAVHLPTPAVHELDDLEQPGLRPHDEVVERNIFSLQWIIVDSLLPVRHPKFPLVVLGDGDIRRVANHQHDLLVAIECFRVRLRSVILQVVVMREEDLGNRRILVVQIVEGQKVTARQSITHLIKSRQHDAQPSATTLTERHDDAVGARQFVEVFPAAQAPLDPHLLFLRQEEQQMHDQVARRRSCDDVHPEKSEAVFPIPARSYSTAAIRLSTAAEAARSSVRASPPCALGRGRTTSGRQARRRGSAGPVAIRSARPHAVSPGFRKAACRTNQPRRTTAPPCPPSGC